MYTVHCNTVNMVITDFKLILSNLNTRKSVKVLLLLQNQLRIYVQCTILYLYSNTRHSFKEWTCMFLLKLMIVILVILMCKCMHTVHMYVQCIQDNSI